MVEENEILKAEIKQLRSVVTQLKNGEQIPISDEPISCQRVEEVEGSCPTVFNGDAVKDMEVTFTSLNDENKHLHEQLKKLREDKVFADSQVESLKLKVDELTKEKKLFEQERHGYNNKVHVLNEQLQQADYTQLRRTQQLQDALRESREKHEEALKTIEAFRIQVNAYDKRIEGLDASLVQARARNADLEKKLASLPHRIRQLEHDLSSVTKEKESRERKLKELSNKLLALEQELAETHLEKERFRLQYTEYKNKAEQQLKMRSQQFSDIQMRCEVLQKEIKDKEMSIQQLVREKTTIGTELYALKSQLSKQETEEYQVICKELNAVRDEVKEWKTSYNTLKKQDEELEKRNNLLLVEIKELTEKITQFGNQHGSEKQDLQSKIQELISTERQYKDQIATQEKDLDAHVTENDELRKILSERDKALDNRIEEFLLLEEEAQRWRANYEDVLKSQETFSQGSDKEQNTLRTDNNTLKELVHKLQEDVLSLTREKEPLRKENEMLKRQQDCCQAEIVELKHEKESLFSNTTDLQEQTYRMQDKLSVLGKQYESVLHESNYLREKLKEHENSRPEIVASLEQEIATIRNRETKLQEEHLACGMEIEELTNENSLLRKTLDEQADIHAKNKANFTKQSGSLQGTISTLQQEVLSLRKETETLAKENDSLKTMLNEDAELHGKDKESLRRNITTLENNKEKLEKDLERLRTEKTYLIQEANKLKTTIEKEREATEKHKRDLQHQIVALQDEADRFHKEMTVIVKENDSLSAERDSLVKDNDDLRKLRDEETSLSDQDKESLQNHILLLEKKISKLQRDLNEVNNEISSFKSENENLKMILDKERSASKIDKHTVVNENKSLRKTLDEQQDLLAKNNTNFRKEITVLQNRTTMLQQEILVITKEKETLVKDISNLKRLSSEDATLHGKEKETLLRRISSLENLTESLEKEMVERLTTEKNALNEDLSNLKNTLEEERKASKQIERKLRDKVAALQDDVDRLHQERANFVTEKSSLSMDKDRLIKEKENLQNILNDERNLNKKDKVSWQNQICSLEKQISKTQEELDKLVKSNVSLQNKNEGLRNEIEEERVSSVDEKQKLGQELSVLNDHNARLRRELNASNEDYNSLKKEFESNKQEIIVLETQLITVRTDLEKERTQETSMRDGLENQIVSLDERNKELKDQISKLRKDLDERSKENDHLVRQNADIRNKLDEEKRLHKNSRSSLYSQVTSLEEQSSKQQETLTSLNEENKSLTAELAEVREKLNADHYNQENLQDQIASFQVQITKLKGDVSCVNSEKDHFSSENKYLANQNATLQNQITTLNKNLSSLQKDFDSLAKENEELKSQVAVIQDERTKQDQKLSIVQKENAFQISNCSTLQNQINDLEEQFATLQQELMNVRKQRDSLTADMKTLRDETKTDKDTKENFQRKIVSLQEQISRLRSELTTAQTENDYLTKENKDLKGWNHVIEDQIAAANIELSQVKMEKEYLVKQNDDFKRQISAFRDQIARLNKDFLNIQKEKDTFGKENKNLKCQLVALQDQITKVNKDLLNFEKERDYFTKEKKELDDLLISERKLHELTRQKLVRQIEDLQNQIENLQEENIKPAVEEQVMCQVEDTVDAAPDDSAERLQELQDAFDNYREEQEKKVSNLNTRIANLEDELASIRKLKKSLNDELLAFKNSSQLKQDQLTRSNERNNQLKIELANKEQTITEMRRKMVRLTELELELKQYKDDNDELEQARAEILSLKDTCRDNEFLRKIMGQIENDRDNLRNEKNKLQESLTLLNQDLLYFKSLEPQLRETKQTLSDLQTDKKAEIESLTLHIKELESSHTLVEKTTIIEIESRIMIKEQELRDLKEQLDTKLNECECHLKELQDARSENAELKIDKAWKPRYESLKLHYKELEKENVVLQNEKQNLAKQLQMLRDKVSKLKTDRHEVGETLNANMERSRKNNTVVDPKTHAEQKKIEELQKELGQVKQELFNKESILVSHEKQFRSLRVEAEMKDNKITKVNKEKEQLRARITELEYEMKQPNQFTKNASDDVVKTLRLQVQELEIEIISLRAQLEKKIVIIKDISLVKETLVTRITELQKTVVTLRKQANDTEKTIYAKSIEPQYQSTQPESKSSTLNIEVQGYPEVVEFEVLVNELEPMEGTPREISTLFVPIKPVSSIFKHQEIKIQSEHDQEEKVIVVPVTPKNSSRIPDGGDFNILAVLVKVRDDDSDNISIASSFTSRRAWVNVVKENEIEEELDQSLEGVPGDTQVGPLRYKFEYPKQGPTALPLIRNTPPIRHPTEIFDVEPDEDPQAAIKKRSLSAIERECFVEPDVLKIRPKPIPQAFDATKLMSNVPITNRLVPTSEDLILAAQRLRKVTPVNKEQNKEIAFDNKNAREQRKKPPFGTIYQPDPRKRAVTFPVDERENGFQPTPTDVQLTNGNGAFRPVSKNRTKPKGTLIVEQFDVPAEFDNNFTPADKPRRFSRGSVEILNEETPQSPLKISYLGTNMDEPDYLPSENVTRNSTVPQHPFPVGTFPRVGRRPFPRNSPQMTDHHTVSGNSFLTSSRREMDGYASDSSADYHRPLMCKDASSVGQSAGQQKGRKAKKKRGALRKGRHSEHLQSNQEPVISFDI